MVNYECLNDFSDWNSIKQREIDALESQAKESMVWFVRVFILFPFVILILIISNELLGDSYTATGTVAGYSFAEGELEGATSMFSDQPSMMSAFTYFREDADHVSASTESGKVITFLCLSCNAFSYKSGDSIRFIVSNPLVGNVKYSELK